MALRAAVVMMGGAVRVVALRVGTVGVAKERGSQEEPYCPRSS